MRRLLTGFLILIASVYVGTQLRHDPGYVLIALHHWTLETTALTAFFLLLIAFLGLYWITVLLSSLLHLSENFHFWRKKRRIHKAHAKTRQALIEFSEGHWLAAKNHLIKALPDSDTPLFNYLTAARAAQEMGDSQLRDTYLREAQQSMPDAKIAVELTQAQLQIANQQWEQALATLRHLQDMAPKHPYVLKLLMQLYQEIKDWPQLIALLPELKKYQVLPATELDTLSQRAWLHAIHDLIRQEQSDKLTALIADLPKSLRYDQEIIAAYASFLIDSNQTEQAETLLQKHLKKQYSAHLINLYGKIAVHESQLVFAESLLAKQPHCAELYLCLGRLSLAYQLWGKANYYFEQSLLIKPTPEAYLGLGQLHEARHETTQANTAWRAGLALAVNRTSTEPKK